MCGDKIKYNSFKVIKSDKKSYKNVSTKVLQKIQNHFKNNNQFSQHKKKISILKTNYRRYYDKKIFCKCLEYFSR